MDVKTPSTLVFFINGEKIKDDNVNPSMTLLEYLRLKLKLCGTKLGCAEGGCGACTVMVSSYDRLNKKINHFSVNACLAPICSMHGLAVTTIEGIGSTKSKIHPVQERIAKSHGSQCGFCTPGIVMSMYTLIRNKTKPSVEDLGDTFQGNLCRCTGYRPILQGYQTFTEGNCCLNNENFTNGKCCRMVNGNGEIIKSNGPCCQTNGINETNGACCKAMDDNEISQANSFTPYDPSQEPIFPPELLLSDVYDKEYLIFEEENIKWIRPSTLEEILELKSKHPNAKFVVGNTEIGIEVKFKKCQYPLLIAPTNIKELKEVKEIEKGLVIGSAVSLSQLQEICQTMIATRPEFQTRIFQAIGKMLKLFAGKQIRNVGCIGGNLMTASPISDLNPILLAANCEVTAASKKGLRKIPLDQNFFNGYRKTLINTDEIVLNIFIPFTVENEFFFAYKQSKRREDDIAIVNAAFRLVLNDDQTVQDISMAYGGMAPTTVMPLRTPAALKGKKWNDDLIDIACRYLEEDLPLEPDAPGSMIAFRRSLTTSFFFKFYLSVLIELGKKTKECAIPENYKTAVLDHCNNEPMKASQYYNLPGDGQNKEDMVGRPVVHLSGIKQATGEAVYCDDIPQYQDELHLALVISKQAHAKILSINPEAALKIPGVITFLCHKDVYYNKMGIFEDEEVFASTKVTCQGQVIGAVVAIDRKTAQLAAQAVVIDYEPLEPVIITIEDAIQHQAFNWDETYVQNGDPLTELASADNVIEGEMRVGAQEHFYLETQCSIAIPKNEDNEMEIISATQGLNRTQADVAKVLGVQANRITIKTKRIGGGYGGKETKSLIVAIPCAIAASKLGRPVRCMLDREEDMVITGTRHPFLGKYKVGFTNEGKIVAVDTKFYSNIGNNFDASPLVMEHCLISFEGGYYLPHVRGTGTICSTNLPSNTAFRGFGTPQGCMITEAMIDQIAHYLGKEPSQIREMNLLEEGQQAPYKQEVINCTMKRCWSECMEMSDYKNRRLQVDQWNKNNRWKKRGLAIIPAKFPVSFTMKFLNQAGALIHVYNDGSVLISHGGVEIGQGLHTKMIQVASRVLGLPVTKIHISETSTDKVPNASPTAGSMSSDLNGMAIIDACNKIKHRLEPIIRENPKGSWEEWIKAAYFQSISLSATGFYAEHDISDFDFKNQTGKPFAYYSFGVGCSEVEIDCLTGDHTIIRTDIVMDVGESLNPAIDVGQIEGAFVQGYGFFMMEEHRYSPEGYLYTRGPGMYKIPGFGDIPKEFNVALLKSGTNPRSVYSSKAVGEPPLFLSASVYFAVKNAIYSARADEGRTDYFQLNCPATAERIRMACVDRFTQQIPMPDPATYKPWSLDHL